MSRAGLLGLLAMLAAAPATARADDAPPWHDDAGVSPGAGISADPQSDRLITVPTAEVLPGGAVAIQVDAWPSQMTDGPALTTVELGLLGRAQLSVTGGLIGALTLLGGGGKLMVHQGRIGRVAVHGSLYRIAALFGDDGAAYLTDLGITGSLCLDAGCHSAATASTIGVVLPGGDDHDALLTSRFTAGLAVRMADHVKLLAELSETLHISPDNFSIDLWSGLRYGLRFTAPRGSLSVVAMKPHDAIGAPPELVMVQLTVRVR